MQPKTDQNQTQGQQTDQLRGTSAGNSNALSPNQVKSIQLNDGWHDTKNVELVYVDEQGKQQRGSFNDILSISDSPRER